MSLLRKVFSRSKPKPSSRLPRRSRSESPNEVETAETDDAIESLEDIDLDDTSGDAGEDSMKLGDDTADEVEIDLDLDDDGAGGSTSDTSEDSIVDISLDSDDDSAAGELHDGSAVAAAPGVEPKQQEVPLPSETSSSASDDRFVSALDEVHSRIDLRSREVQGTVRDVGSEQSSIIQSLYRLIDERTLQRSQLNERRREVWRVLQESLSDIRDEISGLRSGVPGTATSAGAVEQILSDFRSESRESVERLEKALNDLRDDQWKRTESMIAELREAERERVDKVLEALKEEGSRRVADLQSSHEQHLADAREAGERRVFDAIRTGDERVKAQRDILRGKVADLEKIYQERLNHIGEVYEKRLEAARVEARAQDEKNEQTRRKGLLQIVSFFDTLDHRLRLAQAELRAAEQERLKQQQEQASEDDEAAQEPRAGFLKRLLSKRDFERFEAERINLEGRLQATERRTLDELKARVDSLEDLRGLLLITLKCEGVEPFSSLGEAFDSARHVSVEKEPARPGQSPGTVVAVKRCGYLADGDVLRPAEVVVAAAEDAEP